jgi:rubrerythrin
MRLALHGELGARSLYGRMGRQVADEELARVFAALAEEEERQVERLRDLMEELGGRGPARSRRRALTAALVAFAGRLLGPRPVLRLCQEAEATIARWYAAYEGYLLEAGEVEAARTCRTLALTKHRHAQILSAFLENAPRGAG